MSFGGWTPFYGQLLQKEKVFLTIRIGLTPSSSGRNLSIQNSHAIILFRANINLPSDDPTVKRTLHQSMDILSQCYTQDKRKTYHALTFADHAIQYFNIYADSVACNYLQTAKTWLQEERKNAPWNLSVKRLLTNVSNALNRGTA